MVTTLGESDEKDSKKEYKFIPFVLFMGFAMGSWIDINSIFSQLGFLMNQLPEGYELPSYMNLLIQIGNICPLLYIIGRSFAKRIFHPKPAIYFILSWGMISLFILAFVYDKVISFNNNLISSKGSSFPLLIILLGLSFVDTLSTITFLPYMSIFPAKYLSPFFIGQSLSGFFPGVITLIQGIKVTELDCSSKTHFYNSLFCSSGKSIACNNTYVDIRGKYFSSNVFFGIISFIMLVSLLCFILIDKLPFIIKYRTGSYKQLYSNSEDNSVITPKFTTFYSEIIGEFKLMDYKYLLHLLSLTIVSLLCNGVILQMLSFSCQSFDPIVFHVANNLFMISGAITSFILLWKSYESYIINILYCGLIIIVSIVLITISVLGYKGINMHQVIIPIVIVICSVVAGHIYNGVRQTVCVISSTYGSKRMFICSMFIQIGSFLGAFIMFFPISVGCVFS